MDRHHAGTGIALTENDGPGAVMGHSAVWLQLSQFPRIDLLQQGMLGKDRELVFQSRDGHSSCLPESNQFVRRKPENIMVIPSHDCPRLPSRWKVIRNGNCNIIP